MNLLVVKLSVDIDGALSVDVVPEDVIVEVTDARTDEVYTVNSDGEYTYDWEDEDTDLDDDDEDAYEDEEE